MEVADSVVHLVDVTDFLLVVLPATDLVVVHLDRAVVHLVEVVDFLLVRLEDRDVRVLLFFWLWIWGWFLGSSSQLQGAFPGPSRGGQSSDDDEEDCDEEEECCGPPSSTVFAATIDVGSTQAGTLSHGSVVHVPTSTTNRKFDASKSSEPAVLSMSIWEDMKFLPLPDIQQELQVVADDWSKNENKALIESLNQVFKSDTCVIDLESEADTIICSCGHQCIHYSNVSAKLVACPMCRAPITAFVRAKDNFGYVGVSTSGATAHSGGSL